MQVIYPSRPDACGDGQTFIGNVLDTDGRCTSTTSAIPSNGWWNTRPCVRGPARVVATVISGEVTRFAPTSDRCRRPSDVRTVNATAADAAAWLGELLAHAPESRRGDRRCFR